MADKVEKSRVQSSEMILEERLVKFHHHKQKFEQDTEVLAYDRLVLMSQQLAIINHYAIISASKSDRKEIEKLEKTLQENKEAFLACSTRRGTTITFECFDDSDKNEVDVPPFAPVAIAYRLKFQKIFMNSDSPSNRPKNCKEEDQYVHAGNADELKLLLDLYLESLSEEEYEDLAQFLSDSPVQHESASTATVERSRIPYDDWIVREARKGSPLIQQRYVDAIEHLSQQLSQQKADGDAKYSSLEARYADLEAEHAALKEQHAALKGELATLKEETTRQNRERASELASTVTTASTHASSTPPASMTSTHNPVAASTVIPASSTFASIAELLESIQYSPDDVSV